MLWDCDTNVQDLTVKKTLTMCRNKVADLSVDLLFVVNVCLLIT